jgi:hypothetical protein
VLGSSELPKPVKGEKWGQVRCLEAMVIKSMQHLSPFFMVHWGFEPVKSGFINSPSSLYDTNIQTLVKILNYHDKFIKFSSYEKRGGNLG